jgi:hypothetical protein
MPAERARISEPACFAKRILEPCIMQKIAIGLSALLLAAAATGGAAQRHVECAGPIGCPDDRTLSGAQALTSQANPRFAQSRTVAAPAAVSQPSRIERNDAAASSPLTWREDPSLMDSSWHRWPSLIDF